MNTNTSILNDCTGAQLLMLAIANAGLRRSIGRELDSRARAARRRPATAGRIHGEQPALRLRRAG